MSPQQSNKMGSVTPLMKQFNEIKKKHPDTILLFQVGDFYETFGDDAVEVSKILDIVLTSRSPSVGKNMELAGFPHHSLHNYLPRLVKAGKRIAICEQLEDPKKMKGLVKRGVTEVITPGLILDDYVLKRDRNNFLACLHFDSASRQWGLSLLDLSTGEFLCAEGKAQSIEKHLAGFKPAEVLYSKSCLETVTATFGDIPLYPLDDWLFDYDFGHERLTFHFKTKSLKGFGIENMKMGVVAAGIILHYLEETAHRDQRQIRSISRIDDGKYLWVDDTSLSSLEVLRSHVPGGKSLLDILDQAVTAMGKRLLRKWMILPLLEISKIRERQELVECFFGDPGLVQRVRGQLKHMADLERLASKVAIRRIRDQELIQLKNSLKNISSLKEMILEKGEEGLKKLGSKLEDLKELSSRVEVTLTENLHRKTGQGEKIKPGCNPEFDDLRVKLLRAKDRLVKIQREQALKTGISSLKLGFTTTFGYYLEVSHKHREKVPSGWIRKQTLINGERYIISDLKSVEEILLGLEEEMGRLEGKLIAQLVEFAGVHLHSIQKNARIISLLDCYSNFAHIALENGYVKPRVIDSSIISIKESRHPVVEKTLAVGEPYTPNDVLLDSNQDQILIITGPNMSGKSNYLRQVALNVLMAQMGSFIPAKSASIGVVDRIFTRVGAQDNLSMGESTFMVEMNETANILNNLTERSLVIMDEIGRGTSTYDGISIAWSVVQYLHNHPKYRVKTLFATHYHELNELEKKLERVRNFNVSVRQIQDKVIFLHKLVPGGSRHSFGIHVATMAGIPAAIVQEALQVLRLLEKEKSQTHQIDTSGAEKEREEIAREEASREMLRELEATDLDNLTPLEALKKIHDMRQKALGIIGP